MTVEDFEIEIPQSDLKFLKEHGFHLEEGHENKAGVVPKTVYLKMNSECSESLEFMIVFTSEIGSYYTVKHYIHYPDNRHPDNRQFMSQMRGFTKRFEVGHLTEAFSSFMEDVHGSLVFGEDIISKRILQFCQEALDIHDESKMLGMKSCNVYKIQ